MKRKVFILYICCIVFLNACSSQSKEKEEIYTKKTEGLQKSSDELANIKTSKDDTEKNIENTEAIQKIKSIIEQEQKEDYIIDISFYLDYMYLAVAKEGIMYLQQYKLGSWEKQEVNTAIAYQTDETMINLIPFESGIKIVNALHGEVGHTYTTGHTYIYNDKLEQLHIYENISVKNVFGNDLLYVYEQKEQEDFIDNGILYIIEDINESKRIIRDFNTVTVSGHEIAVLYGGMCLSNDGRYLYFRCSYWNEQKTKTKDGWGVLDLQDSNNDILYEEIKEIRKSQNGIIVTDTQNINVSDTLTDKYTYIDNQNEKTVKNLEKKEESPVSLLSSEGNIILTWEEKKGIIRIYDVVKDILLYKKADASLEWVNYGSICEKYHMILGMEMIHESNEKFSPTGKYNILIEQY